MQIYHLLSEKRLAQKLAFAEENDGQLLLTTHAPSQDSAGGALGPYLHTLPNLVGGIDFARRGVMRALRVTLSPDARIVSLAGPRTALDLAAAASDADLVHVRWEEPGLVFQEWFLIATRAIVDWTADPAVLGADYRAQRDALERGHIGAESFFYTDIPPRTQAHMADHLGHRLGFRRGAPPADLLAPFDAACDRLGVHQIHALKNLFFAGPPFLALAAQQRGAFVSHTRLAYVEATCPWGQVDMALSKLASRLSAAMPSPAGPLEVVYRAPDWSRDALATGTVWLGVRIPEGALLPDGLSEAAVPATEPTAYRGPLWDLEATLRTRFAPPVAALHVVLEAFAGARSPNNKLVVFARA